MINMYKKEFQFFYDNLYDGRFQEMWDHLKELLS
jgi:hypothetical protein